MRGCLDSWAVIAWVDDHPSASEVERCIRDGARMSWINVGEVDYILRRRRGDEYADEFGETLERLVDAEIASPERVRAASRLRATFPMAYADCFAVATALAHDLPLLTGDPEIIEAAVPRLRTIDLRQ